MINDNFCTKLEKISAQVQDEIINIFG